MTLQELSELVSRRRGDLHGIKPYATNINAAWELAVEQPYFYLFRMDNGESVEWECKMIFEDKPEYYARAPTAEQAICEAYLKLPERTTAYVS